MFQYECGQAEITTNLNRAMHDNIFRPPAVLTDTIECEEGIPGITNQLYQIETPAKIIESRKSGMMNIFYLLLGIPFRLFHPGKIIYISRRHE